jgi:hypothetical protein
LLRNPLNKSVFATAAAGAAKLPAKRDALCAVPQKGAVSIAISRYLSRSRAPQPWETDHFPAIGVRPLLFVPCCFPDLQTTLMNYLKLYNHHIPQRALDAKTPILALKECQQKRPELFVKRVYDQTGLDT